MIKTLFKQKVSSPLEEFNTPKLGTFQISLLIINQFVAPLTITFLVECPLIHD